MTINPDLTKIRLRPSDVKAIIDCFRQFFTHPQDEIWLFGSRVYPDKRGGDIDLYIQTDEQDYDKLFDARICFSGKLQSIIGEQKIDIVLHSRSSKEKLLIYKVARAEGIRLA